jgi:hypothetical protein
MCLSPLAATLSMVKPSTTSSIIPTWRHHLLVHRISRWAGLLVPLPYCRPKTVSNDIVPCCPLRSTIHRMANGHAIGACLPHGQCTWTVALRSSSISPPTAQTSTACGSSSLTQIVKVKFLATKPTPLPRVAASEPVSTKQGPSPPSSAWLTSGFSLSLQPPWTSNSVN